MNYLLNEGQDMKYNILDLENKIDGFIEPCNDFLLIFVKNINRDLKEVKEICTIFIKNTTNKLIDELKTFYYCKNIELVLKLGGELNEILFGSQFHKIILTNLPIKISESEIRKLFLRDEDENEDIEEVEEIFKITDLKIIRPKFDGIENCWLEFKFINILLYLLF